MKNSIAFAFATLLATFAFAETLTYSELVFTKNNVDENGFFYLGGPTKKWCSGSNMTVQFNSYEAAQYVESLANGQYICQGKFVSGQYAAPTQIYAISDCKSQSDDQLKQRCQNQCIELRCTRSRISATCSTLKWYGLPHI